MTSPPVRQARQLVGRQAQLAAIESRLADLDQSRGALLLLAGEPGIGKTRLAEEIVALARERGTRAVWSSCWHGDGAPPLWSWAQILRQLTGSASTLDQPAPESPTASAAARFAQFELVATQLVNESHDHPLVVVIDDLHWADADSIRMLTFVALAVRDAPCLLVATYRTDEVTRDDAAELARVGTTIAVPRLSDRAVGELLRTAVGSDVGPAAVDAIVTRSNGNPLFVWEFGQLMAQSGRVDVAPAAVPGAVAAVMERRLARISEADIALLRVAAVAGTPFPSALVAKVSDVAVSEVVVALERAAIAGLVVETDTPATFAFTHDLLRDVVLEGIDPINRAALHHRVAIEFEGRALVEPSFHAVVADHLSRAGPAHAAAAAQHWEEAGRGALRVLAYVDAAACFAHASANCVDDPVGAVRMLIAEGDALLLAGDLEPARERFRVAAHAARAVEDAELFATAVLGIGTGPVAWEVPLGDNEQTTMVADALALLPEGATRLRSMLLARQSVTAATPETLGIARQRAETAIELAQQIDDPSLIGQALAALNDALAGPTHTMTRRDNADTIVELAVDAGDRALELLGYRFRVVADLELGDIAAVDRDVAAFTRLAEGLRQPLLSWYVPLFRGMRALLAGDLPAAARHQRDVAAAAEKTGSRNAELLAATLRIGLDFATGSRPPADFFDNIIDIDPESWATFASGMAMVRWLAGDLEGARELLKLHADNGFSRLGDDAEHLTTLTLFSRVAVGLAETAAAGRLYQLLQPHSGLWVVDGIAACCWGPVDLELARLAVALDRLAEAREHLVRASRSVEDAGAAIFVGEVRQLEQVCAAGAAPSSVASGDDQSTDGPNVFHHDGPFWTLTFRGRTVRMKDAKGLRDLSRLLAEPGRELHVLDLSGTATPTDPDRATGTGLGTADLGELLDARARAEYRRRLAELDDDLADAEACADLGRADKARAEREFLAHELASALGLGGQPRRAGDPTERARKAVTARIRLTIGRIDREHAALARHLTNSVRTGTYCAYEPESATTWAT